MGAPRRERLHALALLGLLCDHADAAGRVHIPLATLAGEFDLAPLRAQWLLDRLADVEIARTCAGEIALAGVPEGPTGGLRLAGFLANVAAVLDDGPAERAAPDTGPYSSAPAAVEAASQPDVAPVPMAPAPARARPKEPVLAGLAAVALVLLSTLAPSSDGSTALRAILGSESSTVPAAPADDRPGPEPTSDPVIEGLPVPSPPAGAASPAMAPGQGTADATGGPAQATGPAPSGDGAGGSSDCRATGGPSTSRAAPPPPPGAAP
ncbi:MAG: hypothetical protein ACR2K0_07255, partial [Acidimicrobiales bacterium]